MVVRRRLNIKDRGLIFVATTVRKWKPVFENKILALTALNQFQECLDHYQASLVGYVLMPSHLHALVGLEEIERLSRFMQSFKILSSKRIKNMEKAQKYNLFDSKSRFSLWKPRFDDLLIVSEKQFQTKLDYIHENPVRTGLVDSAVDWPYSSAIDWLANKTGILAVDKNFRWVE